jgi:hypothetical protein
MNGATVDWLFEQNRAEYYRQLDRIDKLRDRLSFVSGLISLLGGAMLYIGTNYPHSWHGWKSLWFYLPAGVALCLFITSVWMLLYCLGWGFRYAYTLSAQGLETYVTSMQRHSESCPDRHVDVLGVTKKHLLSRYTVAATHNFKVNQRRARVFLRATQLSIGAFALLLMALPSYVIQAKHAKAKPVSVLLTEPVRIQK